MTIPDEAVQAASNAVVLGEDAKGNPVHLSTEEARAALTAAAPFLQGVKVDSMDTAPKNGDEFLARCGKEWPWFSCFWDGSAFVHYDHTDGIVHYPATEWIPIPKRMLALAPSPRAQALEVTDDMLNAGQERLCQLSASTNFNDYEQAEIFKAMFKASGLSALSSQPVADGWLPIETAPKDGTVIQAWHKVHKCPVSVLWKDDGFPYRGERLNWYERSYTTAWPERAFTHWRPLPASPGASE